MDLRERKQQDIDSLLQADDFVSVTVKIGNGRSPKGWTAKTDYTVKYRKRVAVNEERNVWEIFTRKELTEMAETQNSRVWVSASNTINLKNFNSAKIEAGIAMDVEDGENFEDAFSKAWDMTIVQVKDMRGNILEKVFGE